MLKLHRRRSHMHAILILVESLLRALPPTLQEVEFSTVQEAAIREQRLTSNAFLGSDF